MDDPSKWRIGDHGFLNTDWQFFEEGEMIRLMRIEDGAHYFYFSGHGTFRVPLEIVNRMPRKRSDEHS